MKRILLIAAAIAAVACGNAPKDALVISSEQTELQQLFAPWDGLTDNTVVTLWTTKENICFKYVVEDSDIILCEPYTDELCVNPEDRIEIFFSARPEMDIYYCAEIDPMGRVMDYSSLYYRQFDYEWNFSTISIESEITENGYIVAGSIAKQELKDLGIDLKGLYMGIFRADFHPVERENWYSRLAPYREFPDFHIPEVMFPAVIK